jgi:hypothetical protein
MELQEIINRLEDVSAADIVTFLCDNNMSFEVFSDTVKKAGGWDSAEKRKNVQSLLKQKDDDAYNAVVAANTVEAFQKYLSLFQKGNHAAEAQEKIQQIQNNVNAEVQQRKQREKMLREIKEDINEYTPDEIIEKLSCKVLEDLCNELDIDAQMIKSYKEPPLRFNDIPQHENDVPEGYTDVFFWGIPSSGKTCALAAILSTIKKDFSMEAPDCEKKFGATYRDSLVGIFHKDCGYLPGRTNRDRTQYMPFLFYKRGENNKRKISFFELSGEVFKHFYEVAYNTKINNNDNRIEIEESFKTLALLLNSNNQKIHFFFLDYNQETKHTKDDNNLMQSDYLEAAATYFRDNKDIFKTHTDAVYVIVTKSDEIKDNNKVEKAKEFLDDNFGSFMDVLKNQCKRNGVEFKVKLFSIGDVYFKKICKIDRSYSIAIINDLLERVKPVSNCKFSRFLNS